MPEATPQQISTIVWLLRSGGLPLLALGVAIAVMGIVFVMRPSRTASTIVAFLSLVPAIVGLILVYSAASDYAAMAVSPTPPKPTEFAAITGRAMSVSFCSLLGTLVAMFLAVLAMCRCSSLRDGSEVATHNPAANSTKQL